jgi:hypothetical protein
VRQFIEGRATLDVDPQEVMGGAIAS